MAMNATVEEIIKDDTTATVLTINEEKRGWSTFGIFT